MNLLINEPPLQVLPSLAVKVGLNEAIFLQQLHFRLQISNNVQEGYKWIYKTYDEWAAEEFPFWSRDTVKRTIAKLEKEGYLISTSKFNKMKMDNTKWYRIDYTKMASEQSGQNAPMEGAGCTDKSMQNAPTDRGNLHRAIPKEIKSIKNNNVEQVDIVCQIVNYLNEKAGKNFNAKSAATKRLLNGRLAEGYVLEDFHRVIDEKVKQWLNNAEMNKYLRPATLFNPTNFENYLNEAPAPMKLHTPRSVTPPNFDFNAGEDVG
ncbi:MAG: conserved phage C-terminal domain-containing protein [Solibacillus sp.]